MFDIKAIKSDRDSVFEKPVQKQGILPSSGSFMIAGMTGSGKTMMMLNLLSRGDMLKDYYDEIFVFCVSPCSLLKKNLKLTDNHIINDDPINNLKLLVDTQKDIIHEHGFKKAPHVLFIWDDMVQNNRFYNSEYVKKMAFASTHFKISIWMTTQSYVEIPRKIRINVHYLAFFHGAKRSELNRFIDEYESPYLTKEDFLKMVKNAIKGKHSFIFVNNKIPDKSIQFRKGFSTILKINS